MEKVTESTNQIVNLLTTTRVALALDPYVPVDILMALMFDRELKIRAAVAKHPNCTIPMLEVMAKDSHIKVRRAVANNLNCPYTLAASAIDGDTKYNARRALCRFKNHTKEALIEKANISRTK